MISRTILDINGKQLFFLSFSFPFTQKLGDFRKKIDGLKTQEKKDPKKHIEKNTWWGQLTLPLHSTIRKGQTYVLIIIDHTEDKMSREILKNNKETKSLHDEAESDCWRGESTLYRPGPTHPPKKASFV